MINEDYTSDSGATSTASTKRESTATAVHGGGGLFGKSRYKFWVIAGLVLLAFWSMFTGSVTLKWSTHNLTRFSNIKLDTNTPSYEDLDILEVEEREKEVRHMWDVYTHSTTIKLPHFWLDAFQAAYEQLTSEIPSVRDAAVSEIAKMSLSSEDHPISIDSVSMSTKNTRRSSDQWTAGKIGIMRRL